MPERPKYPILKGLPQVGQVVKNPPAMQETQEMQA